MDVNELNDFAANLVLKACCHALGRSCGDAGHPDLAQHFVLPNARVLELSLPERPAGISPAHLNYFCSDWESLGDLSSSTPPGRYGIISTAG